MELSNFGGATASQLGRVRTDIYNEEHYAGALNNASTYVNIVARSNAIILIIT